MADLPETPHQRKWRLVREHQEAKAAERAAVEKATRKPRRKASSRVLMESGFADRFGVGDNLGESPNY
jgi:hypothetical protein